MSVFCSLHFKNVYTVYVLPHADTGRHVSGIQASMAVKVGILM
jgi:hypothetical protein